MSYDFFAWLDDEAPDLEAIAQHLDESLPEPAEADLTSQGTVLEIREDDWTLVGRRNDASFIAEEAEGLADRNEDALSDAQLASLRGSPPGNRVATAPSSHHRRRSNGT